MKKRMLILTAVLFCAAQAVIAGRAPIPDRKASPYLGAVVIDAATGEALVEKDADVMVYPASVVKLMTFAVVMDAVDAGTISLQDMVPVSKNAMDMGGSQVYLDVREQFSLEDMLYAIIVKSANDAAIALAEYVSGSREAFVKKMNQKARELGMKRSRFHSPHGLPPSEGQAPDITTARDIATLCRAMLKHPATLQFTSTKERGFRNGEFMMRTHNKLLYSYPGCDGFKTGYYRAAGFSLAATAERDGKRVIAAVMGCVDKNERNAAASELLNQGFAELR